MFDPDKLNEVARPRSEKAIRLAKERKLKRQNDMTNEEYIQYICDKCYVEDCDKCCFKKHKQANPFDCDNLIMVNKALKYKDAQYEEMMNNYRRRIEELEHSISLITFVPENKK